MHIVYGRKTLGRGKQNILRLAIGGLWKGVGDAEIFGSIQIIMYRYGTHAHNNYGYITRGLHAIPAASVTFPFIVQSIVACPLLFGGLNTLGTSKILQYPYT